MPNHHQNYNLNQQIYENNDFQYKFPDVVSI